MYVRYVFDVDHHFIHSMTISPYRGRCGGVHPVQLSFSSDSDDDVPMIPVLDKHAKPSSTSVDWRSRSRSSVSSESSSDSDRAGKPTGSPVREPTPQTTQANRAPGRHHRKHRECRQNSVSTGHRSSSPCSDPHPGNVHVTGVELRELSDADKWARASIRRRKQWRSLLGKRAFVMSVNERPVIECKHKKDKTGAHLQMRRVVDEARLGRVRSDDREVLFKVVSSKIGESREGELAGMAFKKGGPLLENEAENAVRCILAMPVAGVAWPVAGHGSIDRAAEMAMEGNRKGDMAKFYTGKVAIAKDGYIMVDGVKVAAQNCWMNTIVKDDEGKAVFVMYSVPGNRFNLMYANPIDEITAFGIASSILSASFAGQVELL